MNQICDLVFPPLLACWLFTFLLQRKKTQSLIHRKKSRKFLRCLDNVRLGIEKTTTLPKFWGRRVSLELFLCLHTYKTVIFIKALICKKPSSEYLPEIAC